MIDIEETKKISNAMLRASTADSVEDVRQILLPYYDSLVDHYESDLVVIEEVYCSGSDTYGYSDLGEIQGTLDYLADRWNSCARVRWLIDLINPEYTLWAGQFQVQ